MNKDEAVYWLSLIRFRGLGIAVKTKLIEYYGTAPDLFAASSSELHHLLGHHRGIADKLLASCDESELKPDLKWLEQPDCHLVSISDKEYPALLKQTSDPPLMIYVQGDPDLLTTLQIGIVGSRNPTQGGIQNSRNFAKALVQNGFTVTSGLALGIDSAAHRGALEAGGHTVAVAATGLDQVYPARNRILTKEISQHGVLISEFPIDTAPLPRNFPRRNRIISGLSLGVLVVEAAQRSGSLITARCAGEQGREVFAIPGSIHSPQSRGCHALIRQGAKLVESVNDILEEVGSLAHWTIKSRQSESEKETEICEPKDSTLLKSMGYDPISLDLLVERSGLTTDYISSMLLQMELQGLVETIPGGMFVRLK